MTSIKNPKFTIVVPHYDGSISDDLFCRGLQSLIDQKNQDFEVLIYHDGPTSRPVPELWRQLGDRAKLTITKKRKNDWGHSNRDLGIKEANGEYIVHFNPDNILYPFALEEVINECKSTYPHPVTSEIIIMPIIMRGMRTNGSYLWRQKEWAENYSMIFTGYPTIKNNIDAMQLIMSNRLWYKYGGWYDRREQADGNMYPLFVYQNGARYCSKILGEHW